MVLLYSAPVASQERKPTIQNKKNNKTNKLQNSSLTVRIDLFFEPDKKTKTKTKYSDTIVCRFDDSSSNTLH